jgi:hypothetical protein
MDSLLTRLMGLSDSVGVQPYRRATSALITRRASWVRRHPYPPRLVLVGLPTPSLLRVAALHGSVGTLALCTSWPVVRLPRPSLLITPHETINALTFHHFSIRVASRSPCLVGLPTPSLLAAPHGFVDVLTPRLGAVKCQHLHCS